MPIVQGMDFEDTLAISCLVGDKQVNGFTIVVTSRDAADATVECDGTTYPPLTMVAYGTDQGGTDPVAFYHASQVITVADKFAKYDINVSQSGNSVVYTQWTRPTKNDRYRFSVMTCQDPNITALNLGVGAPLSPTIFPFLETLLDEEGMPFTDSFWVDDIVYIDGLQTLNTGLVGVGSTGAPKTTLKEYDYGIGYAASILGLLPGDLISTDNGYEAPYNNAYRVNYGRLRSKNNFWRKVGLMPQFGNHEFGGFEGVSADVPLQTNGAFHKTSVGGGGGKDGAGYTAYEVLFMPLQPTDSIKNLDTYCNLWGLDYGAFCIVSPDTITNNKGVANTVVIGNDQIDDVKAKLTISDLQFKMVISMFSPRKTDIVVVHAPLMEANTAEYERLVTNTDGIMASGKCNGALGTFFWTAGDTHRGEVFYYHGTQGIVNENFYFFTAGMPNKYAAHGSFPDLSGYTNNEVDIVYNMAGTGTTSADNLDPETKETNEQALIFDVYGDLGRVRIRRFASYWDGRPVTAVFDEWFEWKKGNRPIDINNIGYQQTPVNYE